VKKSQRPLTGLAACLILIFLALSLSGTLACSSDDGGDAEATTSSSTATTVASTTSTDSSSSTTVPPVALSDYQKELAHTASVQNDLAQQLVANDVATDDPSMALILGLRARVQALTCAQALSDGDLDLARQAMVDVYSTINRGRSMAEAPVAEVLADAYATIETLGDPSDDPQRAAGLLDDFIAALAPLLDLATDMISTTAST